MRERSTIVMPESGPCCAMPVDPFATRLAVIARSRPRPQPTRSPKTSRYIAHRGLAAGSSCKARAVKQIIHLAQASEVNGYAKYPRGRFENGRTYPGTSAGDAPGSSHPRNSLNGSSLDPSGRRMSNIPCNRMRDIPCKEKRASG